MKLITFLVPCYNSQEYMEKCIDSLLPVGKEGEIIVVNDGSRDNTGKIADEYARRYPTIVRVVHQENGGHGEGINQGVAYARGLYFKVVDSDDWLSEDALKKFMQKIRELAKSELPDMLVTNFVYEKVSEKKRYVSSFARNFQEGWNEWERVKSFQLWHVLLMHAIAYRTELLKKCNLRLPKHTFYEDNVFAYVPLARTRTVYYLNVNLYRYYIGREGQSIAAQTVVKNYRHQLRDFDCICRAYSYEEISRLPKGLRKYLKHALNSFMANTLYFTCGADSPERRADLKQMWKTLKERDRKLYFFLRYRTYAVLLMALPWKARGVVAGWAYRALCKIVKLG